MPNPSTRFRPCTSASFVALALSFFTSAGTAVGDVKPHALFTDHMVLQRDAKVAVWGDAAKGENVTVRFRDKDFATKAGDKGFRVEIGPFEAGGPDVLTITGKNKITIKDVLVGDVWLASGQSNMEWPLAATENAPAAIAGAMLDKVRLFEVPKNVRPTAIENLPTSWKTCNPTSAKDFSAVAYYFGRKLNQDLKTPIGLIDSTWGGTPAEAWTSQDFLEGESRLKKEILDPFLDLVQKSGGPAKTEGKTNAKPGAKKGKKGKGRELPQPWNQNSPAALYNGMIAPIQNYAIRGAIWYQGESNASRADQYRVLFPKMIECWRAKWGQGDFPFLFVQLAPFKASDTWAELRESQRETDHKSPNTAMAVITDAGDANDIHPKKKQVVGERLASAALAEFYKRPGVGHSPDLKSMKVEGETAEIEMEHAENGLIVRGQVLQGFTICGDDGKFVPAEATLSANGKILVKSSAVSRPKAVRFGWSDLPAGNLFNKEGFPATPFRTDDFPFKTAPRAR